MISIGCFTVTINLNNLLETFLNIYDGLGHFTYANIFLLFLSHFGSNLDSRSTLLLRVISLLLNLMIILLLVWLGIPVALRPLIFLEIGGKEWEYKCPLQMILILALFIKPAN